MPQNEPDGYMCVSRSWAKPAKPRPFEFCENGAKATAWEVTNKTVDATFFARYTLAELRGWSDHELEKQGRLTAPMRYDAASDRYAPVNRPDAFAEIGRELKALDPRSVVFYTSGRASLEASYVSAVRPGCTARTISPTVRTCARGTSVARPPVIGVPVGTVHLEDFEQTAASCSSAITQRQTRLECCIRCRRQRAFDAFADFCRKRSWMDLERTSGLCQAAMFQAARTYMAAKAVIPNYGMDVTQHRHGVETVKMIVNLLLLRGNIGKPGAGISPIRGHSNVQGQRTVGISEKTKLVPLDKLKELYGFEPPGEDGLTTVDACKGILKGEVRFRQPRW